MSLISVDGVAGLIGKAIDKMFPDPAQRDAARLALTEAQRRGDLDQFNAEISVMLAEAKSADPFTSRARPAFLYVVYILILTGIPVGILSVFNPGAAAQIAHGMNAWLAAIPEMIVELFMWVMLGYTAGRSAEKITMMRKGK